MNTLLLGRVGSHAYGLAHEDSDEDFMGVFAAPTLEVAGLHWNSHRESVVQSAPGSATNDVAYHEAAKYLKLVLKANPTVTELLWLENDEYLQMNDFGSMLVEYRHTFLSRKYVLAAYHGYAKQQLHKFVTSGEWKPKHARHALRLIQQGQHALNEGEVKVRVDDLQQFWDLAKMEPTDVLELLSRELGKLDEITVSPLPEVPDDTIAVDILRRIRKTYLTK